MLNFLKNILIFICLLSLNGAIVYRFYELNNIGVFFSLLSAIISFIILFFYKHHNEQSLAQEIKPKHKKNSPLKPRWAYYFFFAIYCLLFIAAAYILFSARTSQAIISPWQAVDPVFFALYAILTAVLFALILGLVKKQFQNQIIFFLSLHYLLSFSIALIVYKIGYGFDPFIHQATTDFISKNGAVEPKPFYYMGQYSLMVILHKITIAPIAWLDKLLVPVMAAIYLPITLYYVLIKWFADKKKSFLLILILLILPFSFFIITTPQNFAYLLLILAVLLGLICNSIFDLAIIFLISLTAMLIHPIAGIPAILFALALVAYHSDNNRLKKYYYLLIFIASSLALPLAFYVFGKTNNVAGQTLGATPEKFPEFFSFIRPEIIIPGKEDCFLNFVYLYGFNVKFVIALLALAGAFLAWRHRKKCKIFLIYLILFSGLFVSYLLNKFNSFVFLIEYERHNYSDRILTVAAIFLLPFIILCLYWILNKILVQKKFVKISFLIFSAILISASLYISYPRFDNYHNSRGFSVGQSDIEAVKWIEKNSNKDYIVLANQQVSAAALREFGFNRYYDNDIFYYPIPTGGPLYQYYLDMVYKKPSRETMLAAMNLAGVENAYFVLNKYWWAFPKILEEAKLEANDYKDFQKNVWVFSYKK